MKLFSRTAAKLMLASSLFLAAAGGAFAQKAVVKSKAATTKAAVAAKGLPAAKTTTITLQVGAPGPGGGTVFYENPNYAKDGWRYLEAFWTDDMFGLPYAKASAAVSAIRTARSRQDSTSFPAEKRQFRSTST